MLPRVVLRLDELIAQADSPLDRECLKAERAGVLARLGLMADARFALAGLRTQSQRHRSPRLNAWVWIVDGLITHFESIGDEARDKFQRAWLQAEAAQDRPMMALSSAWLAVGAFNASDLPALQRHVANALRLAEPDEHATQARAGLVLADAYRFAGDEPSSRRWYLAARSHASADGDSSMISALLHNMAAMRAGRIGLEDAFGRANLDEARQVLLETESTANYDGGAGAAALTAMVPLMRAQLMMVLGRVEDSLALLEACRDHAVAQGSAHRDARILAERAWCRMHLGHTAEALQDAELARQGLAAQFDADDQAATHARLARVLQATGDAAAAALHQALAEQALCQHEAAQRDMRVVLDQAVSQGLPPKA